MFIMKSLAFIFLNFLFLSSVFGQVSKDFYKDGKSESAEFDQIGLNSKENKKQEINKDQDLDPWWTGTILAASPNTVTPGEFTFTPFLLYYRTYGIYNRDGQLKNTPTLNTLNGFFGLQTGITEKVDLTYYFQVFDNWIYNHNYFGFGDSIARLKYQLSPLDSKDPILSVFIEEIIPTGNYHHLSPDFSSLDGTGGGSWVTNIGFFLEHSFKTSDQRWFHWYFNFFYGVPAPLKVEGLSIYGGSPGTKGRVYPGQSIFMILAFERQLTQNWVLALDITYRHNNVSKFKGNPGFNRKGELSFVGLPSSESYTLAPAIEYNIDENKGIMAGVWFTVAGRNATAFYTPTIFAYFSF
jgi:hypothetical protein